MLCTPKYNGHKLMLGVQIRRASRYNQESIDSTVVSAATNIIAGIGCMNAALYWLLDDIDRAI